MAFKCENLKHLSLWNAPYITATALTVLMQVNKLYSLYCDDCSGVSKVVQEEIEAWSESRRKHKSMHGAEVLKLV